MPTLSHVLEEGYGECFGEELGRNHKETFNIYARKQKLVCFAKLSG